MQDIDVTIRLSKIVHGQPAKQPVTLALSELRHSMLVHFGVHASKVDCICKLVVEKGRCTLGDLEEECNFLIERVSQ